jgi:hypothetical protein
MKKDIIHPTVDGVKVAVARRQDELGMSFGMYI